MVVMQTAELPGDGATGSFFFVLLLPFSALQGSAEGMVDDKASCCRSWKYFLLAPSKLKEGKIIKFGLSFLFSGCSVFGDAHGDLGWCTLSGAVLRSLNEKKEYRRKPTNPYLRLLLLLFGAARALNMTPPPFPMPLTNSSCCNKCSSPSC